MKVGISTSSLFTRKNTEDALEFLDKSGVKTAEVFLESFCEYNKDFGVFLKSKIKNINVHSVHVLTTQYEPQLYSVNERAKADSFNILEGMLECAKELNAKYYTFHGTARLKKMGININYDRIAKITQEIIDLLATYNLTLAYENVQWCYYNYIGFFNEIRKRTVGLKGTLDIKQARLSDLSYKDFINEMKGDIVTVHLSDVDENGKMCLPLKGTTDFKDLFSRLKDVGFNGALLLEVYKDDYNNYDELLSCYEEISILADKIFNK